MYFQQYVQWENIKASLEGEVPDVVFCQDLKTVNPKEIHQHVGFYIFHVISPSPQLLMKFNTHHVYKLHGNDFIYN